MHRKAQAGAITDQHEALGDAAVDEGRELTGGDPPQGGQLHDVGEGLGPVAGPVDDRLPPVELEA